MNPTQLIEWNEPYDKDGKYNLICRMTCEDVIKYQKQRDIVTEWIDRTGTIYTDQQALDDFMVVHRAYFVDV